MGTNTDRSTPSEGVLAEAEAQGRDPRVYWRRRRFIVNRAQQFRVSFLTAAVVLALLLLLNLSLYSINQAGTVSALEAAPELRGVLEAQDRVQLNLTLLGSLVFLVGVFLVTLLESHKTAGAAYHIGRCLKDLREGDLGTRVRLRRGDNLRELEATFNDLASSLQEQTRNEAEILERLADRIEPTNTAAAARSVAAELRALAASKRESP